METVITTLITSLVELIFAVALAAFTGIVIPWLVSTGIPWLKEKRLYNLASKFVAAAEKRANAGTLDKKYKKDYVIGQFEKKGITVTPELDAFIEAAVMELDIFTQETITQLGTVFVSEDEDGDGDEEEPPEEDDEEKPTEAPEVAAEAAAGEIAEKY